MHKPLIGVVLALLVSSMAVVELRHRNRLMFVELQNLTRERDSLNIEWGQLLLEQGAWSEHRRVEETARVKLGMSVPPGDQVVVFRADRGAP